MPTEPSGICFEVWLLMPRYRGKHWNASGRSESQGQLMPEIDFHLCACWKANWPARQNRCLMMEKTKKKMLVFLQLTPKLGATPSWLWRICSRQSSRLTTRRPNGSMVSNPQQRLYLRDPVDSCSRWWIVALKRMKNTWDYRVCRVDEVPASVQMNLESVLVTFYCFLVTDETSIGLVVVLFLQMTKSAQMFWTHCLNNSATLLCCLLLYIQQICTKTQQESYLTQTTFRGVVLVLKQSKQQRCFCSAVEGWRLPPPPLRLCDGGSEQTVHFWTKLPCFNPALLCMCLCKCRHLDLFCLSLFTLYWFLICQKGIIC